MFAQHANMSMTMVKDIFKEEFIEDHPEKVLVDLIAALENERYLAETLHDMLVGNIVDKSGKQHLMQRSGFWLSFHAKLRIFWLAITSCKLNTSSDGSRAIVERWRVLSESR